MGVPLSQYILPAHGGKKSLREIDNHYHLRLVAESVSEVREFQTDLLKAQCQTAITNLRGMKELCNRQDEANRFLHSITQDLDRVNDGLSTIIETGEETLAEMRALRSG